MSNQTVSAVASLQTDSHSGLSLSLVLISLITAGCGPPF
jgi:hypothetical protein